MKQIFLISLTSFLALGVLASCAKEPQDPNYYERAQQASQNAQEKLSRE